jgi:ribosome-binding protein aMBF1 (putative translation factor)
VGLSYDEVMQPYRSLDVEAQRLADAAKVHFEAAYEHTFGIGERIAARREQLHLTQGQVAERAGIRQSDISRIERGKANPTQATLEKVADALDAQLVLAPKPNSKIAA